MTQRYLLRRGDVYYARISLSKKDQELLGRKEIWRSLKVSTQKEALEKLTLLNYKFVLDKVGFMESGGILGNNDISILAQEYGKRVFNNMILSGENTFYQLSQDLHDSTYDIFDSEEEHARERSLDELRGGEEISIIQTSAAISHGSSGGGLFDSFGNLIGITSFMLKDGQLLNFAISIDEFCKGEHDKKIH